MLTSAWSIRWKLTAWYITALLAILTMFAGLMLVMMSRYLYQQTDEELAEEAKELAEEIASFQSPAEFRDRFDRHYAEHGGYSFQVSRLDGTVICGSPWLRAHALPNSLVARDAKAKELQDVDFPQLGLHRVLCRTTQGVTEPLMIHVVVPYAQTQRELSEFSQMLFGSGISALLAACVGGLLIAHRALRPLERITAAAERISAENLAVSIDVENPQDELGRLALTLNRTFGRLRESVHRIQRFTADAAHELRTPLTVMRTRMEVALHGNADAQQLRDSYQIALEQADQLTKLIDQLLTLSREDAGIEADLFEDVCLKSLLKDVGDSLRAMAVQKGISLTIGPIPACGVLGHDISLSRLFFNLLENAIKYTAAGGEVNLSGSCDEQCVQLTVSDTGVGIEADHLPYLFDRFYRVASTRNGQIVGSGLGLAICRSIVEAHRGEIIVASIPRKGTTFTVILPVVSETEPMSALVGVGHVS